MSRRRHPAFGGGPTLDDIERAQQAADEVIAQDARRSGLGNVRPIRHLRAVYNYEDETDEDET